MKNLNVPFKEIKEYINKETNNNPDIIFRDTMFSSTMLHIVFSESLTGRNVVNDFVLDFFHESKLFKVSRIKNILEYLEQSIPVNKIVRVNKTTDMFYFLFSGFTLIFVDGEKECLAIETKATLNSTIETSKIEATIKGPKDAFTENYQTNIGLIRKRIRDKNLWIKELTVGKYSKTKLAIMYVNGIASQDLVDILEKKLSEIDVDCVFDTNNAMELILNKNSKNVFPTFISTEKPDFVSLHLLKGKIAVVVENTQLVIIIPITFTELFHSAEDFYQKPLNASYTRIIRYVAFFITVYTPALYIAITTYNHEAIPAKLLVNFATQRSGVPFPTVIEALLMLVTFEILKETDTRIPTVIGSSLSIVGALVLGEAAVTAGIVSPIMVIVIAITSISGFIMSYLDVINGIRWWRITFVIFSSLAGIIGIFIATLILLINITSMYSLGLPFLTPIAPLIKEDLGDSIVITKKRKYFRRKTYLTDNMTKGRRTEEDETN